MTGESQFELLRVEPYSILNFIIWIWFILAILITQIVFMNVLIAIISDTFDRVWEQRETYILSSQADILEDWLDVIHPEQEKMRRKLFMFIIEPTF